MRALLLALAVAAAVAEDAAPVIDAELVDGIVALARQATTFRPAHAAMLAEAFAASPRDAAAREAIATRVAEAAPRAAAGEADAIEILALAHRCLADAASSDALRAGLPPLTARIAKRDDARFVERIDAIAALADAGAAIGDAAAVRAAHDADAALFPSPADRAAATDADAERDDATVSALLHAQLAVHDACGDVTALAWAVRLQERLDRTAWDEATGTYAPVAPRACFDLERLARALDDDALIARARRAFAAPATAAVGEALVWRLAFGLAHAAPILHLTLVGRCDEPGTVALLAGASRRVVPGFAITALDESDAARALQKRFPGISIMPRSAGKPTAYLCTASMCEPPTTDPEVLAKGIARHAPH